MSLIHRHSGRRNEDDVAEAQRRRKKLAGVNWDGGESKRESGTLYCSDPTCQEGKDEPYFDIESVMVDQWRSPMEDLRKLEPTLFTCAHCGSTAGEAP